MFQLDNSSLPAIALSSDLAPSFRLMPEGDRIGIFCEIDFYSQFSNPNFTPTVLNLSNPHYLGKFFRIPLGFPVDRVNHVPPFNKEADPLVVLPGRYWVDEVSSALNLYAHDLYAPMIPGGTLSVSAVAIAELPTPDSSYVYTLDLSTWGTIAIAKIVALGLAFTLAADPMDPQPGEFTFVGSTLKLYGSLAIAPPAGAEASIHLSAFIPIPAPVCAIATFDLSGSPIQYLDMIDYLGVAFRPSTNPFSPQKNEFFWGDRRATLFMDSAIAAQLTETVASLGYTQSARGEITYEGVT